MTFLFSYAILFLCSVIFKFIYSSVRVIASRILHEICLLIGELAIRRTNLSLIVRLGTKSELLMGEHYCTVIHCSS